MALQQARQQQDEETELQLVTLLRLGDEEARATAVDTYFPMLYGFTSKFLARHGAARNATEIVDWAFVKAFDQIHQYEPSKGRLCSWLVRIARNAAIDHLRTRRRERSRISFDSIDDLPDTSSWADPLQNVLDKELVYLIVACLEQESARAREIFTAIYISNTPCKVVANQHGFRDVTACQKYISAVKNRVRSRVEAALASADR